jgi:hypothetical protein
VVHAFDVAIHQVLQPLSAVALISGGSPFRGSELGQLTWRNSPTRIRSLFAYGEYLLLVFHYNKAEAQVKQPRLVARFYVPRVARLFIALIAVLYPLRRFLHREIELDHPVDQSPFLFALHYDSGKSWQARHTSPVLAAHASSQLGVSINLSTWRHVFICIVRDRLQPLASQPAGTAALEEETLAANAALQAGHSLHIERHHYALNSQLLTSLSEQGLVEFLYQSQRCHDFLGLSSLSEPEPTSRHSHPSKRRRTSPDLPPHPATATLVQNSLQELMTLSHQILSHLTASPVDQRASMVDPSPWTLPPPSECDTAQPTLINSSTVPSSPPPPRAAPRTLASAVDCLRRMLDVPSFSFRSPGQRDAVRQLIQLQHHQSLFVRLPTGTGKSLLPALSAFASPGQTTIVVVPFVLLRENLCQRLRQWGIHTVEYTASLTGQYSLLLVTPESILTSHFRQYADTYLGSGQVVKVFWEEAHLAIQEQSFRDTWALVVPWMAERFRSPPSPPVPFVFTSATCPASTRQALLHLCRIDPSSVIDVHESANVPGLRWKVERVLSSAQADMLSGYIADARRRDLRTLIFVSSKAHGGELARRHSIPFYHAKLDSVEKVRLRLEFESGAIPILTATTAASHGWDCQVDLVIICGAIRNAVLLCQMGGRAARGPGAQGDCIIITTPSSFPDESSSSCSAGEEPFSFGDTCRRQALISFLDDTPRPACQPSQGERLCDICDTLARPASCSLDQEPPPRSPILNPDHIPSPSEQMDAKESPAVSSPRSSTVDSRMSSLTTSPTPSSSTVTTSTLSSPTSSPVPPLSPSTLPAKFTRRDFGRALSYIWLQREKHHVACDFCWFTHQPDFAAHSLQQCSAFAQRCPSSVGMLDAGLRKHAKARAIALYGNTLRCHYSCFTPLAEFERRYSTYTDCVYASWPFRLLLVAVYHPQHMAVIRRQFGFSSLQEEALAHRAVDSRRDAHNLPVLVLWDVIISLYNLATPLSP